MDNFRFLYNRWAPVCKANQTNIVKPRDDSIVTVEGHVPEPPLRPWSINEHTYSPYELLPPLPPDNPDANKDHPSPGVTSKLLPICSNLQELLDSLKYGQRVIIKGSIRNESYFVPYKCTYKWLNSAEICDISSRFHSIDFLGDSLTRHQSNGMFMLYTDDWVLGGLPKFSENFSYAECVCDGQFSEHDRCRYYNQDSMFNMVSSHAYGICPNNRRPFRFGFKGDKHDHHDRICSDDPRPRLVLIHHGPLHNNQAKDIIEKTLSKLVDFILELKNRCHNKFPVYFVWTGLDSQRRHLDKRYHEQTREKAFAFNELTAAWVAAQPKHLNFSVIDTLNMTRDAATSDGYHYLSEPNILKGMYLFNVMSYLVGGYTM